MSRKILKEKKGINNQDGQLFIEYALMFTVIVAVIIYASLNVIKPAANRFFNSIGNVIDCSTAKVESNF